MLFAISDNFLIYLLPKLALTAFGKIGLQPIDCINLYNSTTIYIFYDFVLIFQTSSGSLRRGHCWLIRNGGGIDCCLIRNTTTTGLVLLRLLLQLLLLLFLLQLLLLLSNKEGTGPASSALPWLNSFSYLG